jgi:glycine cleavage system H protein
MQNLELNVDKFTFKIATDRFYTYQGVWALLTGEVIRVGLSDFSQQRSGDIAFADVQPIGTKLVAGDMVASIETIKVNLNLNCPVAGTIVQVNPLMDSAPETINQDPYGEGWLCEIDANNWDADCQNLMDPNKYFSLMKQEAEDEVKKNE